MKTFKIYFINAKGNPNMTFVQAENLKQATDYAKAEFGDKLEEVKPAETAAELRAMILKNKGL